MECVFFFPLGAICFIKRTPRFVPSGSNDLMFDLRINVACPSGPPHFRVGKRAMMKAYYLSIRGWHYLEVYSESDEPGAVGGLSGP